jgi:hypothetical protein
MHPAQTLYQQLSLTEFATFPPSIVAIPQLEKTPICLYLLEIAELVLQFFQFRQCGQAKAAATIYINYRLVTI